MILCKVINSTDIGCCDGAAVVGAWRGSCNIARFATCPSSPCGIGEFEGAERLRGSRLTSPVTVVEVDEVEVEPETAVADGRFNAAVRSDGLK